MLLRVFAAVVFVLLVFGGLLAWLEYGREAGFGAFLVGLTGLVLVDIAWSLGWLVADRRREIAARDTAKAEADKYAQVLDRADARRAQKGQPSQDEWMEQQVTVDPGRAERAARAKRQP